MQLLLAVVAMPAADSWILGEPASGRTILLIAYEFPPSPSPQSLRWAYLARELSLQGNRVHVLAPEHPGSGEGLPAMPPAVTVYRTFAGPVMGALNALARRARGRAAEDVSQPEIQKRRTHGVAAPSTLCNHPKASAVEVPILNWKGRLHNTLNRYRTLAFHAFQKTVSCWLFPDGRAEWYPWAKRRLEHLCGEVDFDVVISSHEPATTLTLGLAAKRSGYRWIADLGDPVLAPYTPGRWKLRAARLERETCRSADLVIVTNSALVGMLKERHGIPDSRLLVLTQGFDGREKISPLWTVGPRADLELLYTGSFYSFRRVGSLLDAVEAVPGVRLSIASITVPDEVHEASRRSDSIRLLGFLPHAMALAWQRGCDVLVNLANDNPCQVPGKFYEYLGAGRPVLHIGNGGDAAARRLLEIPRGWVCKPDMHALVQLLTRLRDRAKEGKLSDSLDLSASAVRIHDWTAIAGQLTKSINSLMVE